jgi:hypothetical protein
MTTTRKPRTKKPKGLGDTIEAGLQAVGIDKVAKWILGEDCGCQERKETLNKLFPYKKANCLTENHYEYLTDFFERKPNSILPIEQEVILKIYNRTFNTNVGATQCATCWIDMIEELKKVFNSYEQ